MEGRSLTTPGWSDQTDGEPTFTALPCDSIAGQAGMTTGSVYVSSKHAVEGLMLCASKEGGKFGIRVNSVRSIIIIDYYHHYFILVILVFLLLSLLS